MFSSETLKVVRLILLVNIVKTQNNENRDKFNKQQSPFDVLPGPKLQIGNVYDPEKIPILYEEHTRTFNVYGDQYYKVFKKNVLIINALNNVYETANFSINAYTHLTLEEFTNGFTGFNNTGLTDDDVISFNRGLVQHVPPMMDWSEGLLEQYIQQAPCKMSYVLSALSNLEAQLFASNGNRRPGALSVRQAYECERQGSCEYGGVPHYVFKALKDTGGVSSLAEYPFFDKENYEYVKGDKCLTSKYPVQVIVDRYIRLKVNNEEDLMYLLAFYGPVVTTIFVSDSIRHYASGVLDPGDCGENATNHAVLLDGYGFDTKYRLPYWLVKSTWGRWGYRGHIRLIRGRGFVCNLGREYIATSVVRPALVTMTLPKTTETWYPGQTTSIVMRKNMNETGTSKELRRIGPTLAPRPVRTKGIFEEIKYHSIS